MKKNQLAMIREKLLADRGRIISNARGTLKDVRNSNQDDLNDEVDFATVEQNKTITLRLRDREAFLLAKIEKTLSRLDQDGEDFGLCEKCGAPIGLKRLLARPVATLCIKCKEEQEKIEEGFAD